MKRTLMILAVLAMALAGCQKDKDDGGDIHTTGTINGHNWVDLGLPSGTLWATTNIGAKAPEDYGSYFAWGETQPQFDTVYSWSSYKYCNGSNTTLTKYCNNTSYGYNGFTDTLTCLLPVDDAATANWGDGWRVPTRTELMELKENCTVTWLSRNGFYGRLFKGTNGNSIFLPAAGQSRGGSFYGGDSSGYYWSSSIDTVKPDNAWFLNFHSGHCDMYDSYRYYGLSVRPVCSETRK